MEKQEEGRTSVLLEPANTVGYRLAQIASVVFVHSEASSEAEPVADVASPGEGGRQVAAAAETGGEQAARVLDAVSRLRHAVLGGQQGGEQRNVGRQRPVGGGLTIKQEQFQVRLA